MLGLVASPGVSGLSLSAGGPWASREKLENFPRTLLAECGIYGKLVFYPMEGREVGITCWVFLPVHKLAEAVHVCLRKAAFFFFLHVQLLWLGWGCTGWLPRPGKRKT